MKINITKKNVIVAAVGFLAGVIVTTSGFLIFRGCTGKQHKRIGQPSFSQSQTYNQKENGGENNRDGSESNSKKNKQPKKNKTDGNKETKDNTLESKSDVTIADNSNNS